MRYQHDPGDPTSLGNDRIWALRADRDGRLWVGTLGGISILDLESGRFARHIHDPADPTTLANDSVFAFHEDPSGAMWIGTWGSGLDRYNPDQRAEAIGAAWSIHSLPGQGTEINAVWPGDSPAGDVGTKAG